MAKVNKTVPSRRRRKKILKAAKGFRGARSRHFRVAKQAVVRAQTNAYRDRKRKKRDFRKLWITRINAAARINDMSYNRFMHGLKLANIDVNRKMLAEMAVNDKAAFAELATLAKQALDS
jgi:large subunit ribosomal protein L20